MALTKGEIKTLLSLSTKKGRLQEKQFMAEGVRLLEEALACDYLPRFVLYAPSELNPRGERLIEGFTLRKVQARSISARECHRLSDTKSPQGILAVFDSRQANLSKQLKKGVRRILVCDKIGDPGNLGTLIRSAVAFNFDLIITTRNSAEVFNPKTIRASMGGFFKIPMVSGVDDADLVDRLARSGITLYHADIKGKRIDPASPVKGRLALVLGSEATGASSILASRADFTIKIPISRRTESLNAAVAGSVLMYWISSGKGQSHD